MKAEHDGLGPGHRAFVWGAVGSSGHARLQGRFGGGEQLPLSLWNERRSSPVAVIASASGSLSWKGTVKGSP